MGNLIEIAKPGRHTATNGRTYDLTEAELRATAKAYNTKTHEAPLVIGHPKLDAPAYGWVKNLAFSDGVLKASCDQVPAEFAEQATTGGAHAKRSASFYGPKHKSNPTPGTYYLRHLGFLGATPPAMKGLADIASFAEDDDEGESLIIDCAENDRVVARLFNGLRDFFIEKFSLEDADRVLPSWEVENLTEMMVREETREAPAFSEEPDKAATAKEEPKEAETTQETEESTPATAAAESTTESDDALKKREAELKRREDELAKREVELAVEASKSDHDKHVSFCEGLVDKGRPLPCSLESLVAFMHRLEGDDDDSLVSFGEGDERSTLEFFREDILQKIPQSVDFSEVSGGGGHSTPLTKHEITTGIKRLQDEATARGDYISGADALSQLQENQS